MKKLFAVVVVLALTALIFTPPPSRSHAQGKEKSKLRRNVKPVPGQYIVVFNDWATGERGPISVARGLAETCAGTNVTVNSVLPGPTASEGVTEVVGQLAHENKMSPEEFEKEFFKNARPTSLLKRFIEPDEIASVVAFVCSPLAAAINGASVRADGGVIKSIA